MVLYDSIDTEMRDDNEALLALGIDPNDLRYGKIIRGKHNLPRVPKGMVWSPVCEHWWMGIPDEEADFMLCKLHEFKYEVRDQH